MIETPAAHNYCKERGTLTFYGKIATIIVHVADRLLQAVLPSLTAISVVESLFFSSFA